MGANGTDRERAGILRVLTTRGETRAFYDKISKTYDLLAEHSEAPMRQAGLDLLQVRPGERVLEIGPGTGHCLVALGRATGPGGWVTGLDLSLGMLQQAVRCLQEDGSPGRVVLVQGDATGLPFPDAGFDAVFMSFTLELFDTPDIPQLLAECRRVLAPDGRIVIVGMSKEGGGGLMVHAFEWTHKHFPNFLDCRPVFVGRALEEAGFRILNTRLLRMWVPVEVVLAVPPTAA